MAAVFGTRPKGMFGNIGQTPGYGDSTIGQMRDAPQGMAAPMEQPQQAPQGRSTAQRIAGYIADISAGLAGQAGPYAAQLQQEQKRQQDLADAQRQRSEHFADWRRQYDYQRANPEPSSAQPYRWESNDGDVYQLGQDGQPQRVFDDPSPRMQFIPDGLGGGSWVSQGGGAPATPQDGRPAIGGVVDDPRKMGGGVGNGTGGFPR